MQMCRVPSLNAGYYSGVAGCTVTDACVIGSRSLCSVTRLPATGYKPRRTDTDGLLVQCILACAYFAHRGLARRPCALAFAGALVPALARCARRKEWELGITPGVHTACKVWVLFVLGFPSERHGFAADDDVRASPTCFLLLCCFRSRYRFSRRASACRSRGCVVSS